jgi:hypothetical protein
MNLWELKDVGGARTFYIEINGKHYLTRHTDQTIRIRADANHHLTIYSSPGSGLDGKYEKGDLLKHGRVDQLATPVEDS